MKKICVIQPVMKGYRKPFFEMLSQYLSQKNIRLQVVYGKPWKEEVKRSDNVDLSPDIGRKVFSCKLSKLLFICTIFPWLKADLVIVEHANKNVLNYFLSLLNALGLKKIGYWGHGRDRQASENAYGERFKRKTLHWADWWFAYTAGAAEYISQQGFDADRITVVENALDTRSLQKHLKSISVADRQEVLDRFGFTDSNRIAVYCGSLYKNKRLDILFDAARIIHDAVCDFRLIIIGNGPLAEDAIAFCKENPWSQYVGSKFDYEKALLLSVSEIWLNPGLVGLGIVDAFCAGLPLITTDLPIHSPEIEYLEHSINGLMLTPDKADFAKAVIMLLKDRSLLRKLQRGARNSGRKYSIEVMVKNFAQGVERCLFQS